MKFNIVIRESRVNAVISILGSNGGIGWENIGPETRQELHDITMQIKSQLEVNKVCRKADRLNKRIDKNCKKAGIE